MRRHVRTSCRAQTEPECISSGGGGGGGGDNDSSEVLAVLKAQNRVLTQMVETLVEKLDQKVTTINNIDLTSNEIHIHVNRFGQENIDHIDIDVVRRIADEMNHDPKSCVLHMAQHIYSDPAHPENITVYRPNDKKPIVMVSTGDGWHQRPIATAIRAIGVKSYEALLKGSNQPQERRYQPVIDDLIAQKDEIIASRLVTPIVDCNRTQIAHAHKGRII